MRLFGRQVFDTCGYCGIEFSTGRPRAFCCQAHYFAFERLPLARQIRRAFSSNPATQKPTPTLAEFLAGVK